MIDWQRLSRRRLVETVCVLVCMMIGRALVNLSFGQRFGGFGDRLVAEQGFDVAVFSWCMWLMIIRFWAVVQSHVQTQMLIVVRPIFHVKLQCPRCPQQRLETVIYNYFIWEKLILLTLVVGVAFQSPYQEDQEAKKHRSARRHFLQNATAEDFFCFAIPSCTSLADWSWLWLSGFKADLEFFNGYLRKNVTVDYILKRYQTYSKYDK